MNHFLQQQDPKVNAEPAAHQHLDVLGHLHDESEGSEFLDDSLRMKEQPFTNTENSVAPGSPDELL
jgi:hypothetical protein